MHIILYLQIKSKPGEETHHTSVSHIITENFLLGFLRAVILNVVRFHPWLLA